MDGYDWDTFTWIYVLVYYDGEDKEKIRLKEVFKLSIWIEIQLNILL